MPLEFIEGQWWLHCKYVGPNERLKGKTALVKRDYTAQFDEIGLKDDDGVSLWHHWHQFGPNDFERSD